MPEDLDLALFLARYEPFAALDPGTLGAVAEAATVEGYAPGRLVLDAFARPSVEVFVVLEGRVDLWNDASRTDGPPDESESPGGLFGFSAMLTERSLGPLAVTATECRIARIPEDAAQTVFATRRGARYLAEQLVQRPSAVTTPTFSTVDDLVHGQPLVVDPGVPVAQAARLMTERRTSCAVVDRGPDAPRRYGLLTDARLRRLVVADGMPGDVPVSRVMDDDPPVAVVGSSAAEALITLLDRGVDHLVVVDRVGGLRGTIGPRDLAASPTTAGVSLHEQLRRATTPDELVVRARGAAATLEDLLSRGLASGRVIAVYSSIVDAFVRRAIQLCFAEHPELSADAFTWLSLGSNGRRETLPSSDVDSAVAFDDTVSEAEADAYRAVFLEVHGLLGRAGITQDEHGVCAARPAFSRTNAQWRAAARGWLVHPELDNGAMMTSLLVDSRPIHGDPGLPAATAVFADLRRHRGTMRLLLQESVAYRARMRSRRHLLTRGPETFEIKDYAVLPVVNLARWAALTVGSSALPTVDRLHAAGGTTMLPSRRAEALVDVFGLLQRIRLRYQLLQLARGDRPSDRLTLDRLSPIDRSLVAEAVREIAAIQRRVTNVAQFQGSEEWATPVSS